MFRPCYLPKHPLKRDFLEIYLTVFFGVPKLKNTSAMRVTFFLKKFKIQFKFRKWIKKIAKKKFFFSWNNCISRCCNNFSLLRREYLSSAVNGLRNSPKIFDITQKDFFNLNCLHRCCRSDFNCVLAHLPCYLSKGSLKQDFLDFHLTTFFRVRKFKNTSAMRVIFFLNVQN